MVVLEVVGSFELISGCVKMQSSESSIDTVCT